MRSQPQPVIPITVLETKLYVPRPREGQVTAVAAERAPGPRGPGRSSCWSPPRPASARRRCSPSGWPRRRRTARQRSAAWLSLDAGDNDPAHFWTYVIAGLRTLAPTMGASALELLQAPQALPVEAVLTTLLNDLGAIDGDVVLVLDDYHVIESREVHDAMAFLLDHLPPQLHLVIASRADPPLPLARLRARGELVEVRAADLRFTADEAAPYLNEAMGLAAHATRRRRPRGSHRGLDRRAAAGRAVDAGPRRRHGVHRRLRRRRPVRRRLPGRGGGAASAGGRPGLPAAARRSSAG